MDFKKVKINTEFITLGQLLKFADVIDFGGEAKSYILEHTILIDGVDTKQRGKKIYLGMKVIIDDSMFFEITK